MIGLLFDKLFLYAYIHSEVCAGQPTFAHFWSTEALLCTSFLGSRLLGVHC